jgi:uncharacterized protein (DUF488 family)
MSILATIGYEGASLEDFLATLAMAGVEKLIDIRDVPQSRRPGFSKNVLAGALAGRGIGYVHLKALGDPKHGREAARAGRLEEFRQIYAAHLERSDGSQALKIAGELSSDESCVLLCYERNPQHCHRTIVADRLSVLYSFQVRHLGVQDGASRRSSERSDDRAGLPTR